MEEIGFIFQAAKQLIRPVREFLRVTYAQGQCHQHLNRSIAAIATVPHQSRPNVDVESLATSLHSQAQTLWKRGASQRVVHAVINTMQYRISRVNMRVDISDVQMKILVNIPEKMLRLNKRNGGLVGFGWVRVYS